MIGFTTLPINEYGLVPAAVETSCDVCVLNA